MISEMYVDVLVEDDMEPLVFPLLEFQQLNKAYGLFIAAIAYAVFDSRIAHIAEYINIEINADCTLNVIFQGLFGITHVVLDELVQSFLAACKNRLADGVFVFFLVLFHRSFFLPEK